MQFILDSHDFESVRGIAHKTWPFAYGQIITKLQMDYMLEMMYSASSLQHQVEKLKHRFIVAYDEKNSAIGFASFSAYPGTNNHHRLHKLYVMPDTQKKGTGKSLLELIYEAIRKNGKGSLELNVNRKNSAVGFYQKLGFEIIRTEDIDIGNGFFMNDYVMEKIVQ